MAWAPKARRGAREEGEKEGQEGERHQDDQRLGVEQGGPVELGSEGGERQPALGQPLRDQRPGKRAPVLVVEVRVERRGEDVGMGEGLDCEEQGVGDQEELQRREIGPPLPGNMRRGQRPGPGQQSPECPKQPSVDIAERSQRLPGEIVQLEIARAQRLLAAGRAEWRRPPPSAARAGPFPNSGHRPLQNGDRIHFRAPHPAKTGTATYFKLGGEVGLARREKWGQPPISAPTERSNPTAAK